MPFWPLSLINWEYFWRESLDIKFSYENISTLATVIQESFPLCLYVYPMCALDNCEIYQQKKICYSAATLQAHIEKFHIMKNSTNQIFYKCDRCTITFKVKNIARSRKAALRNLIGFGGVKLFLLKNVTTTTVTTAIVTNVTHTTVTITTVTVSTDTTVTITTVTTVTITTVLSCVII